MAPIVLGKCCGSANANSTQMLILRSKFITPDCPAGIDNRFSDLLPMTA
jgi:hypothetical protein